MQSGSRLSYADATAVARRSERSEAPLKQPGIASYAATIAEGWDIAGNANGGYLLGIVARAMADSVNRPDPVTISAHYLSPGRTGDAEIDVTTIREGRRFATASATLTGDRPVLTALGTFGDLDGAEGPTILHASPPELPDISDCVTMNVGPGGGAPNFGDKVDLRFHPDDVGFMRGEPSGTARLRAWVSLHDREAIDSMALLCVLDACPPPVFNMDLPLNWVPTIEFTAHVRARPAPGPLACEFATRLVSSGFLEEDGIVWDSEGTLVAQSRQLALVPRTE